jgi:hypothetical protein
MDMIPRLRCDMEPCRLLLLNHLADSLPHYILHIVFVVRSEIFRRGRACARL